MSRIQKPWKKRNASKNKFTRPTNKLGLSPCRSKANPPQGEAGWCWEGWEWRVRFVPEFSNVDVLNGLASGS